MPDRTGPRGEEPDKQVVRHYLSALNNGEFLDALNAFSMDASFRDESGQERHGIREIAAAFARDRRPLKVEIEALRREGKAIAVLMRMASPTSRGPRFYRSVFNLRGGRIRSLVIDPLPRPRKRMARLSPRA